MRQRGNLNLDESDIISFIDWDFLRNPISITKIVDHIKLPKGVKKIVVERDDDYNLKGTLKFEDFKFLPERDRVAGSFDEGFKIEGISDDGLISYALDSCHIGSISFKGANDFVGTADLRISKLKMKCSENTPRHLREWYVNGPSSHVFFGSAEGKVIQYCTRERFLSNRNQKNSTSSPLANRFSTEFVWGKNKDYKFLITKIPTLGPKWSTNVGIEYHEDWGRIPEPDERVKIEELCSFVFGKHLLSVGHTAYDENENIVEVYAHSPWGENAKSFCSKPEYPPIRILNHPKGDAGKIIDYLLPKYMKVSEPLFLEDALWNYWISFDIPLGPNLPIIAMAIETIINSWYNWTKTKSHGKYMEKSDFISLLRDELDNIKKKLDVKTDGEKIYNNILIANQFGITERMRRFFEEINLNLTQAEQEAIERRHFFVHGYADYDKIDEKQVKRQTDTLHTLFNKTLLKILEYKWDYIDRSVEGWPDAQLS
jgi:hypothetical protein